MGLKQAWWILLCMITMGRVGCYAETPRELGVDDGRLAPCPDTPNCASSQARNPSKRVDPIPFDEPAERARARLLQVLEGLDNVEVVTAQEKYIHAISRSPRVGFVDDNEFYLDEAAGVIHMRAAARLGREDLGANRQRLEMIAGEFAAN